MKIVRPYARMLTRVESSFNYDNYDLSVIFPFLPEEGITLLRRVERYARVSHRSEEKQTADSWERFIRSVVLQHGDWSVTEHESVTVEMLVDRGITHEIVRHRIGSYTQESTRFVNPIKKDGECQFINPLLEKDAVAYNTWFSAVKYAEAYYTDLLNAGCAPQIARSVLPNALASKIIITYNLRTWRHFFIMRTSKEAHPQMKQVTVPLLEEFQKKIPILYEDIVAEERQADAMKKAR